MKSPSILPILFSGVALGGGFFATQDPAPVLDHKALKGLVSQLGYEAKDLSETKFEFTISKSDLDIPIAAEISGSKNYIWLTVFFGSTADHEAKIKERSFEMLKANHRVQPSQLYVTDRGSLLMALPIDNRSVSPTVMRRCIDKLTEDVVKTKDLWTLD